MSFLAVVSALLLGSSQPDLPMIQQDEDFRVSDVDVVGRSTDERARDFVGRVAAPPRGRGIGRWDGPVCVAAMNLENDAARTILDRVGEIARSLELTVGEPGCDPNLIFVFTNDGPAQARAMVDHDRRVFLPPGGGVSRGNTALEAFQSSAAPVRWWTLSMTFDPVTGQRAMRAPGEVNASTTLPLHVARGIDCSMNDCPMNYAPITNVTTTARLRTPLEDAIYKSIVIVDVQRVGAIDPVILGDYLAMIGLTQIDSAADTGQFDSVLNLFSGGGLTGLTDWDRAYLEAIYGTHAGVRSLDGQVREVADLMARNARLTAEAD